MKMIGGEIRFALRKPIDDPLGDDSAGDWPAVPDDFPFHAKPNNGTGA